MGSQSVGRYNALCLLMGVISSSRHKAQGPAGSRPKGGGVAGAITNFSFHHMIAYSVTLLQQQKANAESQKHHLAGPCSVDFRMPPYCAI